MFQLTISVLSIRSRMVAKSTLENDTFQFQANLSQKRAQLHTNQRKVKHKLSTDLAQMSRQVDYLSNSLTEQLGNIKVRREGGFDRVE